MCRNENEETKMKTIEGKLDASGFKFAIVVSVPPPKYGALGPIIKIFIDFHRRYRQYNHKDILN